MMYDLQKEMYHTLCHSVENRIVNIHQPYVRPIVRGKQKSKVEFGAKIQVSLMNGFSILDQFDWNAFHEGTTMKQSVENYKRIHGYYPKEVLADKIYCNRENRAWLKDKKIEFRAKPLERPSAVNNHVSPGERNPIEGKFGQAKNAYGMDNIKAKLSQTSESWIASIVMVLSLVKLAEVTPYYLFKNYQEKIYSLVMKTYFLFIQKIFHIEQAPIINVKEMQYSYSRISYTESKASIYRMRITE
ncbi:MAG TPA: transposase [Saprospiraceae bacterium]|nr:transposase [Saprospiraceae bacterium]